MAVWESLTLVGTGGGVLDVLGGAEKNLFIASSTSLEDTLGSGLFAAIFGGIGGERLAMVDNSWKKCFKK